MMNPKLIKTDKDHAAALKRIDELWDARPGSREAEELELWVHLVEAYESAHFPIAMPDPISAIRFRMEQQGLKQENLVPFIGSKSKVSEVLNGKRDLSLAMIRKLHAGLGIPAEVLLQSAPVQPCAEFDDMAWHEFPLAEMVKRGWFGERIKNARDLLEQAEETLGGFLMPPGLPEMQCVRLRQSPGKAGSTAKNEKALWAWKARVWHLAHHQKLSPFRAEVVNEQLMSEIARLSPLENGPVVAREMLSKLGIALVFEPQMPGTRLDGAAIRGADGSIVLAMTLRYDRLDNFWFTLEHELAHVVLHLKNDDGKAFLDDLEAKDGGEEEQEANQLALDAMIPVKEWQKFKRSSDLSSAKITAFANAHRLHPSIPAGRVRKEFDDYRRLKDLVGSGKVRSLFY